MYGKLGNNARKEDFVKYKVLFYAFISSQKAASAHEKCRPIRTAFYITKSDKVEHQRQHDKRECEPLRHLRKLSIKRLGLALLEERFRATGDRAGKTGALTALHENDNGDSKTGENLKNGEDDSESRHIFQSFRFSTN